jgi:hypothetical protein
MAGLRSCRWLVVLAAVLLAGVAVDTLPAAAAAGTVTVSPNVVPAGGTVTVSGSVSVASCAASNPVILTDTALFPPDGFGPTVARNASGAFSTTYTVPASTPPGSYSVGVRCGGGNVGVSAAVQVTAQVSQVPSGAPQAGLGGASHRDGPSMGWVAAGLSLLLVACLATLGLWRRRNTV